jgi:cysteine synthase
MKVYSALGAVRHLLETGVIQPGDTLVDSSSGIYAHALALACHRFGLKCHIVGSTTVDRTLKIQLEILGATVEQVPSSNNLQLDQNLRVRRIGEILRDNPTYHWMRQYHDDIHYLGYGAVADLVDDLVPSGPLCLVGGVGTGASTGAMSAAVDLLRSSGVFAGLSAGAGVLVGAVGARLRQQPDARLPGGRHRQCRGIAASPPGHPG